MALLRLRSCGGRAEGEPRGGDRAEKDGTALLEALQADEFNLIDLIKLLQGSAFSAKHETARVAKAIYRKGNLAIHLRVKESTTRAAWQTARHSASFDS